MTETDASNTSQRLAELSELSGGLAHELRNPLSTMMINLKLLAEELREPTTSTDDMRRRALLKVDALRREAERLQALFDDFLQLMGTRRLQTAAVDLVELVARLAEFFSPVAKNHGLELRVVDEAGGDAMSHAGQPQTGLRSIRIQADENLLRQALLNLLINAQQATPSGGTITMRFGRDANGAFISVSDTGAGITPQERDRIFRPFFSTKPGGSGLGLPITRRIVEEHGGTLTFETQPGQGTTFSISLPGAS